MSTEDLAKLAATYEKLQKECEAAKARLDNNLFDDLFQAEKAYTRLHKRMWAARVAYLAAKGGTHGS